MVVARRGPTEVTRISDDEDRRRDPGAVTDVPSKAGDSGRPGESGPPGESGEPSTDEIELAQHLLREWDEGRGRAKGQLEIRTWGDATSHGRHFDRFVRRVLGVSTSRPRPTSRIAELERQVRSLGGIPVGHDPQGWEVQLHDARACCLAALRVWNDPLPGPRTRTFARLFVAAWHSLALAARRGDLVGVEVDTNSLIGEVFGGVERRGLRENVRFWLDLNNCLGAPDPPALIRSVMPYAQAGLLNFEEVVVGEFGFEYALAEYLTVPLPLSGFRDPSLSGEQLPPDVQAVLARAETASAELQSDHTYIMRVAFVPVVPTSGRDAGAYFVKPGAVPSELADALEKYVIRPKLTKGSRPNFAATHVIAEVERRTGHRLTSQLHLDAARRLGARPEKSDDHTVDLRYAEYISSFKGYLYSQAWIDLLVEQLASADGFRSATGKEPRPLDQLPLPPS